MSVKAKVTAIIGLALAVGSLASAQKWTPLKNQAPGSIAMAVLLTDGTVMAHETMGGGKVGENWFRLTPDKSGSYVNGTWTKLASTPGFSPLYFASAVMADGRVFACGGEYNGGSAVWQNTTRIYNPVSNSWIPIKPPAGFTVGDSECAVLDDGRVVITDIVSTRMALLDPVTLTWTIIPGTGKANRHNEEGWVKLPDGSLLTVSCWKQNLAQRFLPASNTWVNAGTTVKNLMLAGDAEIGPGMLLPDGRVFWVGGVNATGYYNPSTNSWSDGPTLPNNDAAPDGPAALLPNGRVLIAGSPGYAVSPTRFYEVSGNNVTQVPSPPGADSAPCFIYSFLTLPSGETMMIDQDKAYIYTSSGSAQAAWKPVITSVPGVLGTTQTVKLFGQQLNGLSGGTNFGDDVQNATNYPIVRVTNVATGHVTYARTFNHSTMAVATGSKIVSTNFKLPSTTEKGTSKLEVVANGIASDPVTVVITDGNPGPTGASILYGSLYGGSLSSLQNSDSDFYRVASSAYLAGQHAGVQLTFTNAGPSVLTFTNSSSNAATDMVFLWNLTTLKWDSVQSFQGSATIKTRSIDFGAKAMNMSKYVDSAGKVQVLIRSLQSTSKTPFTLDIDQIQLL
jgi:hypothetical protein